MFCFPQKTNFWKRAEHAVLLKPIAKPALREDVLRVAGIDFNATRARECPRYASSIFSYRNTYASTAMYSAEPCT